MDNAWRPAGTRHRARNSRLSQSNVVLDPVRGDRLLVAEWSNDGLYEVAPHSIRAGHRHLSERHPPFRLANDTVATFIDGLDFSMANATGTFPCAMTHQTGPPPPPPKGVYERRTRRRIGGDAPSTVFLRNLPFIPGIPTRESRVMFFRVIIAGGAFGRCAPGRPRQA
jgi:hypothetical protein